MTNTRKTRKPARSLAFDGRTLTITLTHSATRKEIDTYTVEEYPGVELGRGFNVTRTTAGQAEASYAVLLCGPASSCECKGFLRHGHCKHVEALALLDGLGRLSNFHVHSVVPPAPPVRRISALALRCAALAA